MNNEILTICIPTYNRAELLNITLRKLIDVVNDFKCEIIVSDNASIDNTKEIVETHKKYYSKLKYFLQPKNVGYDRNVANCYENSKSEYVWILGDSNEISKDDFNYILEILEKRSYHGIIVNSENRIKNVPSKVFNDSSILLSEIGWHMTLLSSIIMPRKYVSTSNLERYFDTDFIHFGVFFENIVKYKKISVLWVAENIVSSTKIKANHKIIKKNNWNIFNVFGTQWFTIVMSLPNQIDLNSKLKCIKDHDYYTHIFQIRHLVFLRATNQIKKSDFEKAKKILPYVVNSSICKINFIFHIPDFILKLFYQIYMFLKKHGKY